MLPFPPLLIVLAVLAFYLLSSIKILNEYERGVIFRLGRLIAYLAPAEGKAAA
jgi:regulator of protease activity HflC (stomatin/prohibitin superfamily)